ncbi:MAG: hypothetical protein IH866_01170 [Chloroflexi bacterium]|nr:hypothetical protein [Chloroflexota bacterium]
MRGHGSQSGLQRVGVVLPVAVLALIGLALVLLLLLADGNEEASTSSPTGIEDVDAIIDAVERQDIDALLGLVKYQRIDCESPTSDGYILPPTCPEDVLQGTTVDAFLAGGCHPGWVTRGEVAEAIDWVGDRRLPIHAVLRGGEPFAEIEADYRVVLSSPTDLDVEGLSSQLGVSGGSVVWLTGWCDSAVQQIASLRETGAELIYLAPESSASTPDPTTQPPAQTALRITGLFSEPRASEPDSYRTLPPPPPSAFQPWDGVSTVLYDTLTNEELNLGQGNFGRFSPDGTWMGWTAGPPYDFEEHEAWVIELATLERRSLGPGNFLFFSDDSHAFVQPRAGERELVDLRTGETEPADQQTAAESDARRFRVRGSTLDGLLRLQQDRVGSDDALLYSLVEIESGRVVLEFEASSASLAGPGEIVLGTMPRDGTINIFVVDIATGEATFIGTSALTRLANWPLVANDDYVIWTEDNCAYPNPGMTRIFDRLTNTLTELDASLRWFKLTPDGLIARGDFGAHELIDPETLEYVVVIPGVDPQAPVSSSGPDVSWSPDYRYVSRGFAGGHGGLCG